MAAKSQRWSSDVMKSSNALDLENGLFKRDSRGIAEGLKRSALQRSARRSRARTDYQAAMSMLNFYINRAGKNLTRSQRNRLEGAKVELRRAFGRPSRDGSG